MKTKLLISIAFALSLFSCKDVLVEKPKSMAVETFYNTPSEAEGAIAAIYAPLRGGDCFGAVYIALQETSTDYHRGLGSWTYPSEFQGLDGTNIARAGNVWRDFYLSIRNANLVITNVPNGRNIDDDAKKRFVGEARFLRALAYFHLVKNWGGVILRTEDNMTEENIIRSAPEAIYQLIKDDLLFAEAHLPDNAPVPGRATKWAAKTLLADVYFTIGNHQEAAEKAKEVISSTKYSLVDVRNADDFLKLFGPEVVSSTEEVFYLKYSLEQGQGWNYPLYTNSKGTPFLAIAGYNAICSSLDQYVYTNWDDNDLRKEYGWYPWVFGFGDNTILNKKFQDPVSLNPRPDYPLYRYADVLLMFAEASSEVNGQPTVEGIEALNMVRRRAYGHPHTQTSPVDFVLSDYTKDEFVELVRKERGYETQSEGKRWLDLKRTGSAAIYIKEAWGRDIAEKHYLWPIPIGELNYNKALNPITDQNPGY